MPRSRAHLLLPAPRAPYPARTPRRARAPIIARRLRAAALSGVALLAALGLMVAPAQAETTRPSLPAQVGTAHFIVHYDPATATVDYAAAGASDFEEAYSRLVTGGGGSPNAGLRPPVNDAPRGGDGRIDVYLMAPPWNPNYVGGQAVEDDASYPDPLVDSGFLYMTPSLARVAFRFRSAHELMHTIQDAYVVTSGLFTESTANWAAETALPDIEPGDSQFTTPQLPFTCSYLDWKGTACGNGYRQWLMFERLTERYGLGFVHRLWMRHRTDCPCQGTTPSIDRTILEHAIADEPGDATLATSYADYMAAIWDPTDWATTAVDKIHREDGPPVATDAGLSRGTPSIGATTTVDHLATRYIRLLQAGASAPGDQVRVTVTTPATDAAPPTLLAATGPGRKRTRTPLTATSATTYEGTVSIDAANVTDIVLPLINTGTTDDAAFTWHADLIAGGPPAAPNNDERSAPMRIQPRTTVTVDNAYASGRGADEAYECPVTRTATRGTWFVVLVDKGRFTVDARASDFDPAIAIYDITTGNPYLWDCSPVGAAAGGIVTGQVLAREYLIYVGRAATSAGTGHTLRLTVDGTPNSFGGEQLDTTPPMILTPAINPRRFRAAKTGGPLSTKLTGKIGARLTFGLTEDAALRVVFERATTGRKVSGKCVKTTKRNRTRKRCTRYVNVGGAGLERLKSGQITLRLTGRRTTRKALAPGTYRARLTATDVAGNTSPAVTTPFTIKK